MNRAAKMRLLVAMYELEPLLTEIATLLDQAEDDDDPRASSGR